MSTEHTGGEGLIMSSQYSKQQMEILGGADMKPLLISAVSFFKTNHIQHLSVHYGAAVYQAVDEYIKNEEQSYDWLQTGVNK